MPELGLTKKRRNSNARKPMPYTSIKATAVSVVTMLVMVVAVMLSASVAGEIPNVVGGVSMLAALVSVVCFAIVAKRIKQPHETYAKVICFAVTLIILLSWVALYIMGLTR